MKHKEKRKVQFIGKASNTILNKNIMGSRDNKICHFHC